MGGGRFHICGRCLGLYEDLRPDCREQRCACTRSSTDPLWPGFDYNMRLDLCHCCLREALRSGSRWSVWFCGECKERVIAFDRRHGRAVIPIGRHSLMAGVGISGSQLAKAGDPRTEALVEDFGAKALSLFGAMDHLDVWRDRELARRLEVLGKAKGDVPLAEYFTESNARALTDPSFSREGSFRALVAHFAEDASA